MFKPINTEIITTIKQLARLKEKMMKLSEFAFDTETNTLNVKGPNTNFILVGISISWGKYHNYYIPIGHTFEVDQLTPHLVKEALSEVFSRKDVRIIGHNLPFDLHALERIGIFVETEDLFDTMIASWLCNENRPKGLKENTKEHLGIDQGKIKSILLSVTTEQKKLVGLKGNARATMDLVSIEITSKYAMDDSYYTWELYMFYLNELENEKMDKIYFKKYTKILKTIFAMEKRGVSVNKKRLDSMDEEITADLEKLEYEIFEIAGIEFKPNSNQQLAELLFGFTDSKIYKNPNLHILDVTFGFPVVSLTPKDAPQTSGDVLEVLAEKEYSIARKREGVELCKKLLSYKKLKKLKTTFIDGIREKLYDDGKLHASFNIVGTTSGRISCSAPNLQQLPNSLEDDDSGLYELVKQYKIRELFVGGIDNSSTKLSRKKIIATDFKNLEAMVTAHFSEDPTLLKIFKDGGDMHNATAKFMFDLSCPVEEVKKKHKMLRTVAKTLNFGILYGMGSYTLSLELQKYGVDLSSKKILDEYKVKKPEQVAQVYMDRYFKIYPEVAKFIRDQKRSAHKNGYIQTLIGRKRRLEDINSSDFKMVSYQERLAVNACCQGSAGDIMLNAQIRVEEDERLRELGCFSLMQIHDELVCECPEKNLEEACQIIEHYMENPFGDNVKLNVDLVAVSGTGDNYEMAK